MQASRSPRRSALRRAAVGVSRALSRAADLWLPRACALCDATLGAGETGLCEGCARALPGGARARCAVCGLGFAAGNSDPHGAGPAPAAADSAGESGTPPLPAPLPAPACPSRATPGARCAACATHPPAFDRCVVLADYLPPLDRLIVALKFGGEISLARALGARLADRLDARVADGVLPAPALLAPVPLAAERLARRGFNQSAQIAAAISRRTGIPLAASLLHRTRDTPAQSLLPLAQRRRNLEHAFAAQARARGMCVAVVDDVMTSGATLQAVAAALKSAGAAFVINLVAARTP